MKTIKLAFFDFDGCLGDSPIPETGKQKWAEYHGKDYPAQGWWGRMESMCLEAFDIKTLKPQHDAWEKLHKEGYDTFVLTSRIRKFTPIIQTILINNNVEMVDILTKTEATKGERIVDMVKKYISDGVVVTDVIFFDDRNKEIVTAEAVREELLSLGVTLELVKVQSDALD